MHVSKRTALAIAAAAAAAFTVPAFAGNPHNQDGGTGSVACNDGTVSWTPETLWGPPNHSLQTITITYSDNDNDNDMTAVAVTGVSDNQTTDGVEDPGSGNTSPDYVIGAPGMAVDPNDATTTVQVRDERSGRDGDRVYDIKVQCTDSGGNTDTDGGNGPHSQTVDAFVTVPHDMGRNG